MSVPSLSTSKLSALSSSTLPLVLERQRSISIGLQPPAFTEATILKNLNLIQQGLQAIHFQSSTAPVSDSKGLRDGLDRLLGLMEQDPAGKEKVISIREFLTELATPLPSVASTRPASPTMPAAHLPRTNEPVFGESKPQSNKPYSSYRDEEDEESSPFDEPYRDDSEVMMQQREMMSDQDARLAQLSTSINRQHHLSLQIGDELEVHQDLLDDTDHALDRTTVRLDRARRQLDGFAGKAKENASAVTIVILIVLLAILILVFKT
ncbi:SNARE protein TLG1/Syntaxin 6 [Phaffia rhodozyma]|uniref:SNARE protein TLG1/Syntaxin 6 n=1 Tax=Phaffia rhodozyma TaxID=264483 RepID=A0A0F7SGE9_PHARH|nr:SNARE protein TLG1/Syntaxin 6 [Phaffia rhodozyma]